MILVTTTQTEQTDQLILLWKKKTKLLLGKKHGHYLSVKFKFLLKTAQQYFILIKRFGLGCFRNYAKRVLVFLIFLPVDVSFPDTCESHLGLLLFLEKIYLE